MTRSSEQRINDLEIHLAHTQRFVEELNAVVTDQANRLDRLTRTIGHLQSLIEELKLKPEEKRDLLAEKPPHY